MKIISRLFAGLLLLLSTIAFAADKPQTIRFGTDATYPPFEFMNKSGEMQGFDIEIMKAICQTLQAQCTFTTQAWDSVIPSLQLGKFDAAFGAMNITKEREQQVDFTIPYYLNSASIVAPKSSHLTLSEDSLKGKTIGVLSGTTFVQYLQQKYDGNVKINTYGSEQTAFLDLTAGRIDAVMGDTPLIEYWLKSNNATQQYEIVGEPIKNEQYFGRGYGIAVRKGNRDLTEQLNSAILKLQENGTLEKITQQYFGIQQ